MIQSDTPHARVFSPTQRLKERFLFQACGFFKEDERVLIVNRRHEEKVVIITSDGPITITLVSTETTRAKLGFSAPKNIRIFREELLSAATRKEVAHAG